MLGRLENESAEPRDDLRCTIDALGTDARVLVFLDEHAGQLFAWELFHIQRTKADGYVR